MSYNSTHTGAQIDAAIDAVETKQDRLVSGTNIKTINGQSVMGSGNLSIEATGTYECTYDVTTYSDVVAAIQAGKTPIVKIGNPCEDVFTLSEWDKQNEILCFNSAYMEVYEGDDSLSPDFSISAGCVLLKNTPDSTTTPNGWTTSLFQAIPRSGTIYTKEEVDAQLDAKQDILISSTNIKTVNNTSLLGSGNISIGGSSTYFATCGTSASDNYKYITLDNYSPIVGATIAVQFTNGSTSSNAKLFINNANDHWMTIDTTLNIPADLIKANSIVTVMNTGSFFKILSVNNVAQEKLVSGTNIKTINGESVLGSGNIEIQGGGGQLSAWELIGTTTNTTAITIDTSGYNELLLVHKGQVSANAIKYDSTVINVDDMGSDIIDITMGGISTSSGGYGCNAKLSKTSLAPQWVYNGGSSVTAYVQTWKIYGRTNFGVSSYLTGANTPNNSQGVNGDLYLMV